MKILSVVLFCSLAVVARAQETAYKAMNAVGSAKGEAYLDSLLYLQGLTGSTQPGVWRMTFQDVESRSGVREIEVQNGKIVSQRTPVKSAVSGTNRINLDKLQLDSDGAFTVAEQAAVRRRIGFDKANYFLDAESGTGNPVWRVELIDVTGSTVLTLRMAADSGRILSSTGEPLPANADASPVGKPETGEYSDNTEAKINRTLQKTGRRISNGFKHVGGSLQQVFTGKRTIDQDVEDE